MTRPSDLACCEPLPDLAELELRWRALEGQAQGSFFSGWTWMGSWLRATGARPDLLSITGSDGAEIGVALIGRGRDTRKFGMQPVVRLNEAADAVADRVFIEYNAPLAVNGREAEVAQRLAEWLGAERGWRVLRLSGLLPDDSLVGLVPARRRILVDQSPAYFVDLAAVRAADGDYLSLLSSNTRSQIRRSEKDYGAGEAVIQRASDDSEITDWLDEMRRLNAGRHADNAWDAPMFVAFAGEIARAGLADGSVDLLRIQRGGDAIGYLLNFVHRGRAMNYQSAFADGIGPKSKPGLMTHAAAVAQYADRGLDLYSLLAGKDRYKQSLSTGHELLEWWMLERFAPGLEAEYWLRRVLRR